MGEPMTEADFFLFKFSREIKISLGQPRARLDCFLNKFQLKVEGHLSGAAQSKTSIQSSIENGTKLVWGNPGPSLSDLYSNFN